MLWMTLSFKLLQAHKGFIMWHYSYHRWNTKQEFLDTFASLGFEKNPLNTNEFVLPPGVVVDIIGSIDIASPQNPQVRQQDSRWHVNMAWHSREIPLELQASIVTPENPSRRFA